MVNRKKILISVFAIMTACGFIQAQRIKGSDTLLPLTQALAEMYLSEYRDSSIIVTGGGSGVGIAALMENTTDIAMASRRVKFSEKMSFAKSGLEIKEVIVAYDALAVVVNPANPVKELTRKQLEAIFRGKITNWKDVGGEDRKIVVYSRETSSGTYEFFKESVLENKNYMSSILSMPATGAIIQSVRQTKGAIGYIGLAYLNPYVKALSVSYDGKAFYAPSVETAAEGQLAHGYNLLTKENLPAFRAGGYICDFAKLQLTPAFLALPDDLRLAQEEDGAWRLQWVNAPFQAGTAEDDRLQVFLMRDEDSFDPLPVETGEVCRKDGIVRFCIPEEWKACGHLYVFFCSQTGWKSSACRYFRMEDFLYANLIMNEYGNLL